jgi:hypothetical protein
VATVFFIGPILLYAAELFGPGDSMNIVVEEGLNGVNVKANGHFEFILKRNNKRMCGKKDDMNRGMVQNLVGMEVVSDLDGMNSVYGLVTNYIEWIFMKSQNDMIELRRILIRLKLPRLNH